MPDPEWTDEEQRDLIQSHKANAVARWAVAVSVLVLAGVLFIGHRVSVTPPTTPIITPEPERFGLHPDHEALAAPIVAESQPFAIVTAAGDTVVEDNSAKNVRLWEPVRQIECDGKPLGKDWPNIAQQVGDCVSWGFANAANHTLAVEAAKSGRLRGPPRVYPPWLYGISRVDVGRGRLRGQDGSVGAWAAKGAELYGLLTFNDTNVPGYSGSVARQWGNSGPPKTLYPTAKPRQLIQACAPIRSAVEARDSICNGYAVTIASNFGTNTIRAKDGRQVASWDSSWGHQMCLVGYDGSGSTSYFYVLNSWGATAHPAPLQNEPEGGFWIPSNFVDRITSQGDSWGVPGSRGFREQELNFVLVP